MRKVFKVMIIERKRKKNYSLKWEFVLLKKTKKIKIENIIIIIITKVIFNFCNIRLLFKNN